VTTRRREKLCGTGLLFTPHSMVPKQAMNARSWELIFAGVRRARLRWVARLMSLGEGQAKTRFS
jgi:hypothetical protein